VERNFKGSEAAGGWIVQADAKIDVARRQIQNLMDLKAGAGRCVP
jgi:hypothetical protein